MVDCTSSADGRPPPTTPSTLTSPSRRCLSGWWLSPVVAGVCRRPWQRRELEFHRRLVLLPAAGNNPADAFEPLCLFRHFHHSEPEGAAATAMLLVTDPRLARCDGPTRAVDRRIRLGSPNPNSTYWPKPSWRQDPRVLAGSIRMVRRRPGNRVGSGVPSHHRCR